MSWLLLAVAGAVLCCIGDHLHVTHDVLVYRAPFVWRLAAWVPPEFVFATLAAVLGARPFVKSLAVTSWRRILTDGAWFVGAYVYTSYAPFDRPNVTLAVLAISWLLRVIAERRSVGILVSCVVLAICGCLGEGALASTGTFHYLHPDALNVPRWLPGIYLHAGLVAAELAVLFRGAEGSSATRGP
jgi:hypothetical protein